MWLITNIDISTNKNLKYKISFGNYNFYSNHFQENEINRENQWFFEGHIFSRNGEPVYLINNNVKELLDKQYSKYKYRFINHIKGNFVILLLEKSSFKIYSDRFAIKKFFYYQTETDFIISDDLKEIASLVDLKPSIMNMGIYSLTYHFVKNLTLFENIYHNEPAEIIEYRNGNLIKTNYWNSLYLLLQQKQKVNIKDISLSLSDTIKSEISTLNSDNISLSLTGGADTRNLLALFLKKGIRPHLYTYGNPQSSDCVKAKTIANGLVLNHSTYDISIDVDIFETYARRIVRLGGGLASIHRVHRLIAVELEQSYAAWMFLGTMGGEFIRGASEDDYIISSLLYENWENPSLSEQKLNDYLEGKYILTNQIDIQGLLTFIHNEPYMNGSIVERKLNALTYITAHLHDAQDLNLYETVMEEVFTPFIDIDFLEILFSSKFSFDQKETIGNKFLERINNPIYASKFLKSTFPPLLKFLYSGDHKPSEINFNKYYAALAKIIRKKTRPEYPPNFPLGLWMEEFVKKNLPVCKEYIEIDTAFNIDGLLESLENSNHIPTESYWLKYTNPIMMKFIIEEFKN